MNIIFEIEVINTVKSMPVKFGICKNFFLSVRDFADKSYYQYLHLNFIISAYPDSFEKLTFPMSKNWELIEKSEIKNKVLNLHQKIS